MADLKISQLPSTTGIASGDLLAVVQSSTTKQITKQNLMKGNGAATIKIAASNAVDTSGYEFVCTGTGDPANLQSAINSFGAQGGVLQLSEGDFKLSSNITKPTNVIIRGMGRRATRLFKTAGGYYALSILGTGSTNIDKGGLEKITIEGNAQTGGGLLMQFCQTQFINDISIDGHNDVAADIITSQDSYFHQVTFNTNHSTSRPVISIQGSGSGNQNSNMIWFTQCRVEDFWNGAVNIQQGSGYSGNNNGFYFTQCKFESANVGGNMFVADANTLDLHLKDIFFSATGFKAGYSTPVDAINTQAHNLASYEGIYFNASGGIGNSAINITSANGQTTIDNVLFNGTPVTSAIIFGASGASFNLGGLNTGGGTLISGDASGISTLPFPMKFAGNVGFYNTTPIARQLLATGAGHSVDDIISFLQTIGLVKQS